MLGDCSVHNKRSIRGRGKRFFTARRLDYILSTDTIFNNIHDCSVHSVTQSDHRLVFLKKLHSMSHVQRGPSYRKFNESLLHDKHLSNNLIHFLKNLKKMILMNKRNGICVKLK